ncbi:MAG: right-handed parallel beta-helix repeat-containing protein [Anaerolineae bacterium]|nr:right-handed parallel beta-helix repeat-containing protein [Anaerolineae bacterium]
MNRKITFFLLVALVLQVAGPVKAAPQAQTYYVSTSGNDNNNGLSEATPFATIGKVNSLNLSPGDKVLFKCGDVWRTDPLILTHSGSAAAPITYGTYPDGCANKPVLSGAQPITGWSAAGANLYVATVPAGSETAQFGFGINQLFRDDTRLPMGRWPNLDQGDAGYSTIDAQPGGASIRDNELPATNWNGAVAHIRGMRWYILNRKVTGTSGTTLTFGESNGCWDGNCTGWGYFLNNHLGTLDSEGEWYYDTASHKIYLYTATAPTDNQIEGSVILHDDGRSWGGILLGNDLYEGASYVVVENLDVRRWFRHGIATPTNLHPYENTYVTIRNCAISDVDGIGINLATWVWDAADGADGWRGGNHMTVEGNTILRANTRGIDLYSRNSTIQANTVRDVAMIENLGAAGMGCSLDDYEGACTEDGVGIRVKLDRVAESGNHNTVTHNRLNRIGYTGMGVYGPANNVAYNVIENACYSKGDCGGISTFGRDNLNNTPVYDLVFLQNIIVNTIGNTDGCNPEFKSLFGFGLYIDNYSRNVTLSNNTVISSTASGILYQNSTGNATGNTLFHNGLGFPWASEISLSGSPTRVGLNGNIVMARFENIFTLSAERSHITSSDNNYLFHPYRARHINVGDSRTLAEWQAYSGLDAHSKETWYTQATDEAPRARIFYNDTSAVKTFDLSTRLYSDLDQAAVYGSLTLQPFTSRVLIVSKDMPDLALTMDLVAGETIVSGAPVEYTLTISNLGSATATDVVLSSHVPDLIANPLWAASGALAGATARSGSSFVWDLPDLDPGESGVITVSGTYTTVSQTNLARAVIADVSTPLQEPNVNNNHGLLPLGHWLTVYLPFASR